MNIQKIKINSKSVSKNVKRISHNSDISEFYIRYAEEKNSDTLYNISDSVNQCYYFWDIDYYSQQKVKDIKHIQLCKNKFCVNCQNILSNRRENKYTPELDKLRSKYDIYHIVLTVPNCKSDKLITTLDLMYKKFPYLTQYLSGKRKSNDVNFAKFGYTGAVKALEITHKLVNGKIEYHPHFHCIFLFRKGLDNKRDQVNDFSFNNGKFYRYFSDNEIFFQKVWYLLFNNIRVNKKNIDSLDQGYSVIVEKPREGNYHQVFKYVLGGFFKKGQSIFAYDVFKTLYESLYRRKLIQGYGILNKYQFEDDVTEEEIDEEYNKVILELQAVENAKTIIMKLQDIQNELEENTITYISKNSIRRELINDRFRTN